MAIKHATVKAPGQTLAAVADWNADHTGTAPPAIHANEAHTPDFQDSATYSAHDHSVGDPTQVDHANLSNVTSDQHHPQLHNAASHTDIASTGAQIDDAVTKKHTQNTDTGLGAMGADINMNTHQLTTLAVPDANGEAIRQTAKITEVLLESATDLKHSEMLIVPTSNGTATGPTTNAFVSGYSNSAIGDLVYLDVNSKWQKTDADAEATTTGLLGIALEVKAAEAALLVALPGSMVYSTAFITFTIGAPIYVGETPGAMQLAIPTGTNGTVRVVGFGIHADKLYFMPSSDVATIT